MLRLTRVVKTAEIDTIKSYSFVSKVEIKRNGQNGLEDGFSRVRIYFHCGELDSKETIKLHNELSKFRKDHAVYYMGIFYREKHYPNLVLDKELTREERKTVLKIPTNIKSDGFVTGSNLMVIRDIGKIFDIEFSIPKLYLDIQSHFNNEYLSYYAFYYFDRYNFLINKI